MSRMPATGDASLPACLLTTSRPMFDGDDEHDLNEPLAPEGLSLELEVNPLLLRRAAAEDVWLTLSEPAVQVLLGAAGSGLLQGIHAVLRRSLHPQGSQGRFRLVVVDGDGRRVLVEVSGSDEKVSEALAGVPEALRAARGPS